MTKIGITKNPIPCTSCGTMLPAGREIWVGGFSGSVEITCSDYSSCTDRAASLGFYSPMDGDSIKKEANISLNIKDLKYIDFVADRVECAVLRALGYQLAPTAELLKK